MGKAHRNADATKAFGERFKANRLKAGATQLQLAEAVGLTKAAISAHEHGKMLMTIDKVATIADFLGIPIEAMFPTRLSLDDRVEAILPYFDPSMRPAVLGMLQQYRETGQFLSRLLVYEPG